MYITTHDNQFCDILALIFDNNSILEVIRNEELKVYLRFHNLCMFEVENRAICYLKMSTFGFQFGYYTLGILYYNLQASAKFECFIVYNKQPISLYGNQFLK